MTKYWLASEGMGVVGLGGEAQFLHGHSVRAQEPGKLSFH